MATKPLRSVKFPGLPDTYTIPQGGGTSDTYVFAQSVASDTWIIQHNHSQIRGSVQRKRLSKLKTKGIEQYESNSFQSESQQK